MSQFRLHASGYGAFAAAIVAVFAWSLSGATRALGKESPIELSPSDKRVLEKLVCRESHQMPLARADGTVFDDGFARAVSARVECAPHDHIKDKPIRFATDCKKDGQEWKCVVPSQLEMVVAVGERDVLLTISGTEPAWAHEAIRKLEVTGFIRNDAGVTAGPPRCSISRGMQIPEWYHVRCLGRDITISTWCPQGDCPTVVFAHEELEWE
jgi:hypothetical protein